MIRSSSQPIFLDIDRPIRQQSYLAKSNRMQDILTGGNRNEPNSHYIDSLQRFKKDYATYDKEERQRQRQKRLKILEERKNQQIQRQSRIRRNQLQYDQQNLNKINQSRYLCELGLKKTGISNGMPINPITLQYHQNPFGYQQKFQDEQHKLKKLVRAHHIQNASTSGYNPINGQRLPNIEPLVPKNTEGRFVQKLGQFYQARRLDPNVNLQLNPKNMLPRYVGEVDRYNHSPIKGQMWDHAENEFQTAYQSHFNSKPHDMMTRSRMQQQNYYRQMMEQNQNSYQNYGQNQLIRQPNLTYHNQNLHPYLQDEAYRSQMHEMR